MPQELTDEQISYYFHATVNMLDFARAVIAADRELRSKQVLENIDGLPPLSKHDHPDCHTMVWSESEMRAIKAYADAALAMQAARHAEELAAYEMAVCNRDAEIARMRTELHQHECHNFEAVREQRDFLLASQTLLIESAKAGQDAQDTEIANLRAQMVQSEPVAWMHSKTGCVSVSPYDLSLADGDETAIPLYEAPPLSEAEIQDLRDRAIGMLEKSFPEPERKSVHTEAEVEEMLHYTAGVYEDEVRRILNVPAQEDK